MANKKHPLEDDTVNAGGSAAGVQEPPSGSEEAAAPSPAAPIDPLALMASIAQSLAILVQRQDAQSEGLVKALAPALERMAEATLQGAKMQADETKRAHRPSNEVVPKISVFNRRGETLEGYTKPKLRCRMDIPWSLRDEECTREEVELFNLLEPGEYRIRRNDGSRIVLTVMIRYGVDQVTPSHLIMNHETTFNNDHKNLLPSLADMARQMLRQHPPAIAKLAAAIMTDEEEEALIEAGELAIAV